MSEEEDPENQRLRHTKSSFLKQTPIDTNKEIPKELLNITQIQDNYASSIANNYTNLKQNKMFDLFPQYKFDRKLKKENTQFMHDFHNLYSQKFEKIFPENKKNTYFGPFSENPKTTTTTAAKKPVIINGLSPMARKREMSRPNVEDLFIKNSVKKKYVFCF